jgi:hypothetical protein
MFCTRPLVFAMLALLLAGCATAPAPDFGGRWRSVNRYAETVQEIPLQQTYVFYAAPMDGTLKKMLERWATDAKMTLSYQPTSDYTLYAPVANIRTVSLNEAAAQLTSAYAKQHVVIRVEGNRIVVSPATVSSAARETRAN